MFKFWVNEQFRIWWKRFRGPVNWRINSIISLLHLALEEEFDMRLAITIVIDAIVVGLLSNLVVFPYFRKHDIGVKSRQGQVIYGLLVIILGIIIYQYVPK